MKKQYTKLLTFILILLALSVSLYSCGGDPVEFSVNFVVDGETHATVTTGGAEAIKLPENPTKDGYTFDGWYWDNGTWKRPFTENSLLDEPLSADMSVYAKWKANAAEYLEGTDIISATMNVSGDKITGSVSNTTEIFSFLNDITVAKDASYIVATDISCSHPIASKMTSLNIGDNTFYLLVSRGSDIKLYYVTLRRLPTYTVTFNENGGTAVENQTVEEGGLATVPAAPTRAGYTFSHWDYDLTKPITEDTAVSAIWTPIIYSIAYELDGGTHSNPGTYTADDNIILSDAEKTGYTFIGWYDDSDFTNKVESIAVGTVGEITLYAKFVQKPRVELYVDGELWQTVSVDYASDYVLPMPALSDSTKPGGWFDIDGKLYCDSTGTGLINLTESIKLYYQTYNEGYISIRTAEQLKSIAMNGKYFLMNDIDLGGAEWTPVGTSSSPFKGTFDGNGHVVSNFKVTGEHMYAGLFGYNEGKIENLGIERFTVDVNHNNYVYAGGLVGENYGDITNCYATGDVTSTESCSYAGGLVGLNEGDIINSYATGDVTSTESGCAGGLVGFNYCGTITGCYATGYVTSTSSYSSSSAGGLVGYNCYGTITGCYATGDVTSTSTSKSYSSHAYAGGLVGNNDGGTITGCYRYSGQTFTVTENGTTTYEATNTEGTAKDLTTLKSVSFHTETLGWSADVWTFTEGAHPTLKNIGNT